VDVSGFGILFLPLNELLRVTIQESVNITYYYYYKILITVLTNRINNHLLRNNVLPEEQKRCCRMYRRCNDQLLVSKLITSLAKKYQRHLCMAWIDYKKAFESLPHTWIVSVTEMYQTCPTVTIHGGIDERLED
jgi:hypothetical protein